MTGVQSLAAATQLADVAARPGRFALFLDVDGTLIDIAPTPDSVIIPPGLPALLKQAKARFGGALALLSGRAIDWLDRRLDAGSLPIGGLHGLERRDAHGKVERIVTPVFMQQAREDIAAFAYDHPLLLVEDKGLSIALHYRENPGQENAVRLLMQDLAQRSTGTMQAIAGKYLYELRTIGADKGTALAAFMTAAPFHDRIPVFFGDDRTDEDGFKVVTATGGVAVAIGHKPEDVGATIGLQGPADVRAFLASVVAEGR